MMTMSEAPAFQTALSVSGEERRPLEMQLEEHREICWRFLMARMGNHADAQDALQETWIRAHRAWPRYREQGRFRAWILRIARREAYRIQRRNRNRPAEPAPWETRDLSPPDKTSEQQDEVRRLERAIADLSPHEREAVWLRIVEEYPFREIARIQRVPEGTAVTRVRRGLGRLKTRLKGEAP